MLEKGEKVSFLPSLSLAGAVEICIVRRGEVTVCLADVFPHQRAAVKKEEYLLDA